MNCSNMILRLDFVLCFFTILINISSVENKQTLVEDNTKLEDGWEAWSKWSSCSRSCGGGVTAQSRRCQKWSGCKGSSVRYKICQDIPCPEGSLDFLSLQCSEHNNNFLDGSLQKWEPADGGELCVLTCKVKGTEGPPVVLKEQVLDGTACGPDKNGLCVHGQCQNVGCDRILGSNKTLDACGVCGGNGKSCGAADFDWRLDEDGPCSATCGGGYRVVSSVCENVKTKEKVSQTLCKHLEKSPPIISTCAEKPCPASWKIEPWNTCSVSCGRGYQLREVFCAEKNNVSYIRVGDYLCQGDRPPHRQSCGRPCPQWYEGVWSECSVTCGDGVQRRAVSCREPGGQMSDLCDFGRRPNSTRPCRSGVKCSKPTLNFYPAWLSDSEEEEEGTRFSPPEPLMEQERVPSEPTFISGKWSSCSKTCGEGVRTRNVTCKIYLEFSKTVPILPDGQCPGHRPVEAKRCFLRPCLQDETGAGFGSRSQQDDVSDRKDMFSSFEDPKPVKSHKAFPPSPLLQSREETMNNALFEEPSDDDSQALNIKSPNSEEVLDGLFYPHGGRGISPKQHSLRGYVYKKDYSQPDRYQWEFGGYGPCSQSCLGGVEESEIFCKDIREDLVVFSHFCNIEKRPDSITRTCNDHPCKPKWQLSEFSECSKSCGKGIQKRKVICIHEMTRSESGKIVVPDSYCPQPKPDSRRNCNLESCLPRWKIGKWSKCSDDCEKGIRTRNVQCVQRVSSIKEKNLPGDHCLNNRPISKKKCFRRSCKSHRNSGIRKRKRNEPVIRAQIHQNYHQRKFMKVLILKIGGQAAVFHGVNLKIRCPVRRFDRKDISWWRNGAPVVKAAKLRKRMRRYRKERVKVNNRGVLKINKVQYTDAGLYFCKAGPKEANISLSVEPLPSSFASSEEFPEKTYNSNDFSSWKYKNKVYINSLEPPGNAIHELDEIYKPEDNFPIEHKEESNGLISDIMASSLPFGDDIVKVNLHTMEETSSDTPLRPFIYGRVNQRGNPSIQKNRGIAILNKKVFESKFPDREPISPSASKRRIEPKGPIYGTIQNATEEVQLASDEEIHFGTFRETDHGGSPFDISSIRERSTNPTFSEDESGKIPLHREDNPFFSAGGEYGVGQILGNGDPDKLGFEWKVTNWTKCSQTCSYTGSSSGYQMRSSVCVAHFENVSVTVESALCITHAGLVAPPTIQKCASMECPQWKVDGWSDCENSRCYTLHYALQKRNITCSLFNGTKLSETLCNKMTKPRHKRKCFNRQCIGVWKTGDWSKCISNCGGQGYKTRVLQCVWNGTKKSAGNACRHKTRPEVIRWCDGDPCPKKEKKKKKIDPNCKDTSMYCKIVVRINMCQHFQRQCCHSCQ